LRQYHQTPPKERILWAIFQFLVDGGIFERRIRSAVVKANLKSVRVAECEVQLLNTGIFGSAETLPSRKVIHQSLIASCYLPFTIRHSLLAVVLAQQEPCPPNSFRPLSHAPFLSRWLRKRSLLKQAEKLEGASHDAPKFSAVQEHCPPENSSLSTD
jgi:hypothetical protein